jgi:cytochrome P450
MRSSSTADIRVSFKRAMSVECSVDSWTCSRNRRGATRIRRTPRCAPTGPCCTSVRFCQLLLAAGTETTTNLVANALVCLAPPDLARLRVNPAGIPAALEEVLRFRAPVQSMFRASLREVELDGTVVPANAFIVASIGSANRDPEVFVDPDRFEPARAPNPHVAFGHGIHFCLGAPLARLESRIALEALLATFRTIEVARDWSPRRAFHVHGPATLPVTLSRT